MVGCRGARASNGRTDAENRVVELVQRGSEVDLSSNGDDRAVRAGVLRDLCVGPKGSSERVVVGHAQITHRLDLSGEHLQRSLHFRHCSFPDGVDLTSARCDEPIEFEDCDIGEVRAGRLESKADLSFLRCRTRASFKGADIDADLRLTGSRFDRADGPALDCSDMRVKGLYLDEGCEVQGELRLSSSHIERDLDCRRGRFCNKSALAIDAAHLVVDGDLMGDGEFYADGEVGLRWAQVSTVRFHGSTVSNPGGTAIAAEGLRAATGVYLDKGFRAVGSVCLIGAFIGGELRCTGGTVEDSSGVAIDASRIAVQDVYLDRGFRAHGEVRLVGARVSRQLICSASSMDNRGGKALDAHSLACEGAVYLNEGFTAQGQVVLVGATVRDELTCTGALLEYPAGDVLDADGMTTEGQVRLDHGFRAVGGVRLARATIGRQLTCSGGIIERPSGVALDVTGLVCKGDVELDCGFSAYGEVRVQGATITRDLTLAGGRLTNAGGIALNARNLRASGRLVWHLASPPEGAVDFSYADTTQLEDDKESWQATGIKLDGFAYRNIESKLSSADRIEILNRADYAYQPYQALAAIYRGAGRDRDAGRVVRARERDRSRRGDLRWLARTWNAFVRVTVGYGTRLWLPFLIVAVLGLANGFLYHAAEHHGLIQAEGGGSSSGDNANGSKANGANANGGNGGNANGGRANGNRGAANANGNSGNRHGKGEQSQSDVFRRCPKNYPCFSPWAYSVQLLIPGLNLQQIDKYTPSATKPWGTALLLYTWLMVLLGWLLAAGVTAGLNRFIRE